ncbi:hypothetical protein AMTRI_Chr01g132830 [Amborella trichopoda]
MMITPAFFFLAQVALLSGSNNAGHGLVLSTKIDKHNFSLSLSKPKKPLSLLLQENPAMILSTHQDKGITISFAKSFTLFFFTCEIPIFSGNLCNKIWSFFCCI